MPRRLLSCYDVDRNGRIDLTDPLVILRWLFQGGSQPGECLARAEAEDLGAQIAGVYFITVTPEGSPAYSWVASFSPHGTFLGTATVDFGAGDLERNGFRSPEHGVWEEIEGSEVATTSLYFKFSSQGALEGFHRPRHTIRFTRLENGKLQELSGDFEVDVFKPEQDPIADAPAEPSKLKGTLTGRRLNVQ